ncbi:MAG: NAD-dependent epimerase/dehydratase family protein [Clostridia bacterium]|nr:NAD-dependent epimerase/dehydratase family protein [Clostridia bacterium]
MIVSIAGATGSMGPYVVGELLKIPQISCIRILAHRKKPARKLFRRFSAEHGRLDVFYGTIASADDCRRLIEGASYVINMAAVIPPRSDKHPREAIEANEEGPKALVHAIEEADDQPKLIHISTVGLYGHRNHIHPFGRVGDPLLISPFDLYALTKLRGEFTVLESDVNEWAVIRQTAMLYDDMLMNNIRDGLMFHTCFNGPLEWATGHDSGVLIANIVRRDMKGELNGENFWKKCFNLGMAQNRVTGYETLDKGFRMIGGSVEVFFDPDYNSARNFHGMWFSDGQVLEELFHYQQEKIDDFWAHVLRARPYLALGKIAPKKLVRKLVIERLRGDSNAPLYWYRHRDQARMTAYFKSEEDYRSIPETWDCYPLLCKGQSPDGAVDYDELRKRDTPAYYGFDFSKPDHEIDISDLRSVAEAHGGALLCDRFQTGDMYARVKWMTQDGEVFSARPYTVLRCGHWYHISYREYAWEFDRLSRKDRVFAGIWRDSHDPDEQMRYWFDGNFEAGCARQDAESADGTESVEGKS